VKRNGFTLVELMVALFIFALVAAAGVGLLTFSVRSQAAATVRLDALAKVARMNALLGNDLAQVVPRVSRNRDGQSVRAFIGSDGATEGVVMGFVRAGRSNVGNQPRSSVERIDLVLDGGRLERRAYPMIDGTTAGAPTLLADNVTAVALRYRDKDGWRPRWDVSRADAVPRAVELTVTRTGQAPLLAAFLVGTSYP
jgi:general secretion pathway protein J